MKRNFNKILQESHLRLLKLHYESGCGHVGGNFSCIDALMTLYHQIMTTDDQFILSKGHSAGALYVTLWSIGKLSESALKTFSKDNSLLPGHPSGSGIPGLNFSTGSLGHGPALAAGMALAARHRKLNQRIFCLCSDGEWQEGSCWETLIFSVHHNLQNLVILIDQNGLQGFGKTAEIVSYDDLESRLSAFGATVHVVDGHNTKALYDALQEKSQNGPFILLMKTIKGRGLHYENLLESHYLPLTEKQFLFAKNNIASRSIP